MHIFRIKRQTTLTQAIVCGLDCLDPDAKRKRIMNAVGVPTDEELLMAAEIAAAEVGFKGILDPGPITD